MGGKDQEKDRTRAPSLSAPAPDRSIDLCTSLRAHKLCAVALCVSCPDIIYSKLTHQ